MTEIESTWRAKHQKWPNGLQRLAAWPTKIMASQVEGARWWMILCHAYLASRALKSELWTLSALAIIGRAMHKCLIGLVFPRSPPP